MSEIAYDALRRLLAKAESARRSRRERATTLVMSESSFPGYLSIATFEAKQAVHSLFADAQRRGAIEVEWDKRAGERGHIQRLRLVDGDALARYLGAKPHWEHTKDAESALEPLLESAPQAQHFLEYWKAGKTLRGLHPSDVQAVIDGVEVLNELRRNGDWDRPIRALSVKLFGDSKHLESLGQVLDVLTCDDVKLTRSTDEVFANLGLFRAVMPMLIAGNVDIKTNDGRTIHTIEPYIGIPPESVDKVISDSSGVRFVLSVENLTPFYELARAFAGQINGIVLYSGGMPSPSWRQAYKSILSSLLETSEVYHWGDIDTGGFRIAENIASAAHDVGRVLRPHLMDPSKLDGYGREAPQAVLREIEAHARSLGWDAVADGLRVRPVLIEQESILPNLEIGETGRR